MFDRSFRAAALKPRARRCAILLFGLLACCTSGEPPNGANEARRALVAAPKPVRMVLVGNPFEMDQARQNALVTSEMALGITGMSAEFTTSAERAAAPEPHVVVVLNPVSEPTPDVLCGAPEGIRTAPASGQLQVLAAFCRGDQLINATRTEGTVRGPTDHSFRRLLWRTASSLFPDDYAETYGFGILPRWLDFGVGGSVGR